MRLIGFLDKFLIKTSDRTFPVDHLPRRRANALNIQTSTLKKIFQWPNYIFLSSFTETQGVLREFEKVLLAHDCQLSSQNCPEVSQIL